MDAARQRNFQVVIDTCKVWATEHGVKHWAYLYRLVLAVQTESGGLVYANDGKAFHPDLAQRRIKPERWDLDDQGNPLPASVLDACYRAVRASLAFGHDAVGNNGGSTGILQQLSQDYVGARFPGKTWGWGTLADTMNVDKACRMFLSRLVVTSNRNYLGRDFDPIVADVLRVQQPKISEVDANYGPDEVAAAKHLVDNWSTTYFGSK